MNKNFIILAILIVSLAGSFFISTKDRFLYPSRASADQVEIFFNPTDTTSNTVNLDVIMSSVQTEHIPGATIVISYPSNQFKVVDGGPNDISDSCQANNFVFTERSLFENDALSGSLLVERFTMSNNAPSGLFCFTTVKFEKLTSNADVSQITFNTSDSRVEVVGTDPNKEYMLQAQTYLMGVGPTTGSYSGSSNVESEEQTKCSETGGTWKEFQNGCADRCGIPPDAHCPTVVVTHCDCGESKCFSPSAGCVDNNSISPRPTGLNPTTTDPQAPADACSQSGGTVATAKCCTTVSDFPNTCTVGACGCALENSKDVQVCNCGDGKCWDGNTCAPVSGGECNKAGGDFDCKGECDLVDFEIYRQEKNGTLATKNADANGDNVVNSQDLSIWLSCFASRSQIPARFRL